MKRFILLLAGLFVAGLFTAATAMGMSHEKEGDLEQKKESAEWQHPSLEETQAVDEGDRLTSIDLDREQVRELEMLLEDEGYDVGAADGEIDAATEEALREFQREEGLAITGNVNEETLRALAPAVEQQEFFGLSPAFNEEEGRIENDGQLQEQQSEEKTPVLDERIEENPRTDKY